MVEYVPFTISLFQQQKGINGYNSQAASTDLAMRDAEKSVSA